jgi:ferredoxin
MKVTWPKLVKPSTRAFTVEARRLPGYSFFDWLHGIIYARWPYLYIGIGTGEHPLARWLAPVGRLIVHLAPKPPAGAPRITFADTYHGKVVTPQAARQLVSVQREIVLKDLEHVIPYALAKDIVLKNPDHIVALECPCRAARPNPCLPLDVCLIIGEPFASYVAEHHTKRTRWITSDEAAAILAAEHERGHVHHAFFKDAMLGRFYAICNCCSCCCGAMQAQRNGTPMLASSGYVARTVPEACQGCGTCAPHCQFGAINVSNGHAVVDEVRCMGCGVCVSHCARQALSLQREPSKGVPLELDQLMSECMAV